MEKLAEARIHLCPRLCPLLASLRVRPRNFTMVHSFTSGSTKITHSFTSGSTKITDFPVYTLLDEGGRL
jgi:hypothetical protein